MYIKFVNLKPSAWLMRRLDRAYEHVMYSGTYIKGSIVQAFEEEWADYIGTKHCIGVGSGSDALLHLCPISGMTIVPKNSTPTIDALSGNRSLYISDNIDLQTHNLRPHRDGPACVVHLYGCPADIDEFSGYPIIEDCAQAHGAKYKGRKCGTLADAAAWSFYPTKNLGAYGDAGAITTDNDEIMARVRQVRGARMDPLQAAFLRVKLPQLDGWNARRKEIAQEYLEGLEGVSLPFVPEWAEPCWHLFVIRHPDRDKLKEDLMERGIETMVHYEVDKEVLSLPCAPHLTDKEVNYVIEAVNQCAF
jgi:dTDP-4-amino-4,6-dideoxygalactose transaminase